MDLIPCGLNFSFVSTDDVLNASKDEHEHSKHLCFVFRRFQKYGISVNIFKCTELLGH